jgi:hypothetical protein
MNIKCELIKVEVINKTVQKTLSNVDSFQSMAARNLPQQYDTIIIIITTICRPTYSRFYLKF